LHWRGFARIVVAALVSVTLLLPPSTVSVSAAGDTRTLYLHHTHTGETGRFTFKRNGQYDRGVLRDLNRFLADWRNQKQTQMDPALFDLLWVVYQEVGASQPISIVSSYRSPETNAALRKKSSGVAENSQHMNGKAMDFYIPGVSLKVLRETAMRHQVGGVGYYPTSGSPFVHLDTGSVRAWPRMTTAQLKKIFPDGRTLHLPADGRVLSADGRSWAQTQWDKCHMVPCSGDSYHQYDGGDEAPTPATPGKSLMDVIFGDSSDDIQVASVEAPTQRTVQVIDVTAPVPLERPDAVAAITAPEPIVVPFNNASEPLEVAALDPSAPMPLSKSAAMLVATGAAPAVPAAAQPSYEEETALVALANLGAPAPRARVLMTNAPAEQSPMVTAYVPTITPDPGAQRALEMIIERETTASLPLPKPTSLDNAPVQTASLGGALQGLLENTWDAVTNATQPGVANALLAQTAPAANTSFDLAPVELIAPDLEHVAEVLAEPVAFSSRHFSEFYEAEGFLAKTAELGELAPRLGFEPDLPIRAYDRFAPSPLIVVALR
jgi:uncharacterized protein YcbK (DUF882 family)